MRPSGLCDRSRAAQSGLLPEGGAGPGLPDATSHSRESSKPPENNVRPSGEKANEWTKPEWPARADRSDRVARSHIQIMRSGPPDASSRPSGEKARA
jgi:hypothetical protein